MMMVCSETLSINSFHYVQVNLQTYYDMMLQNRKEAARWSRRFILQLVVLPTAACCTHSFMLLSVDNRFSLQHRGSTGPAEHFLR